MDIDEQGTNHLIFGEALNYDSPGSIWYVKGKKQNSERHKCLLVYGFGGLDFRKEKGNPVKSLPAAR
jgi:hypothetical protein